jgi:hypothetical protein
MVLDTQNIKRPPMTLPSIEAVRPIILVSLLSNIWFRYRLKEYKITPLIMDLWSLHTMRLVGNLQVPLLLLHLVFSVCRKELKLLIGKAHHHVYYL